MSAEMRTHTNISKVYLFLQLLFSNHINVTSPICLDLADKYNYLFRFIELTFNYNFDN